MLTKIIKITVDEVVYQFEMLEDDVRDEKTIKHISSVISAFPDGVVKDDNTLTPQLWWGNLDKPSIIILGLNPSCLESDFKDNGNPDFKEILKKNLSYNNREKSLNLDSLFNTFSDIEVIKTWMNKYKLNAFSDELKNVAIYNLFGYYQTNLTIRNIRLSHIKGELKKDIIKKIKKANRVYFLWGGKNIRELWIKLLCEKPNNEEDALYQKLKNARAANENDWRNPDFSTLKNN